MANPPRRKSSLISHGVAERDWQRDKARLMKDRG